MRHHTRRCSALVAALFAAGLATAQTPSVGSTPTSVSTTTTLSGGQLRVAERIATPFATLAGSQENALALTTALRTGTPATLTYTTTPSTTQTTTTTTTTTTTITPPTAPMGWGNVSHALALARYALSQAGVTSPTGADLNAALAGGEVTVAGQAVPLSGVLAQRASGMGWGQIARSYGTTMGAVNRSLRSGTTATATAPVRDAQPAQRAATTRASVASADGRGVTTAEGTASSGHGRGEASTTTASPATAAGRGLTTAAGSASSHAAKGLTTAGGAASRGTAIVAADGGSGHGASNAQGRGIVTASGASAAAGAAGASRATSAAVTGNNGVAGRMPVSTDAGGNGGVNGRGKGG